MDWDKERAPLADRVISALEGFGLEGLRDSVVFREIITPADFEERYGANKFGLSLLMAKRLVESSLGGLSAMDVGHRYGSNQGRSNRREDLEPITELVGGRLADVIAIIGSIDIVMGECDR